MGIRLCVGAYARNGYEPENMGFSIYSVEELCYFIRENAGILEDGLVNESLIDWLEMECRLETLAESLREALEDKAPLTRLVEILLQYTGFYPAGERKEILQIIAQNSGMSVLEKRKAKADALVLKGRIGMAKREYEKLLEQIEPQYQQLRGSVYHGCGVCLARLFYLQTAGEYFWQAYQLSSNPDSLRQYLLTLRLLMSEQEYLQYLSEHKEVYEASLWLEEQLELWKTKWKESAGERILLDIRQKRETGCPTGEQELRDRIETLKENYRKMVQTI